MTAQEPIPADVRDLLTALRDLLDVPLSAHYGDRDTQLELSRTRLLSARLILDDVLKRPDRDQVAVSTEVAKTRLNDLPVTYTPDEPETEAEQP